MKNMEINKIVGAVLVALLVATAIGHFADLLTAYDKPMRAAVAAGPAPMDEPAPADAEVAAAEAPAAVDMAAAEAEVPAAEDEPADAEAAPFTVLLAAADAEAGAKRAKARCAACHTFDQGGANKVGPNLWNIVGRDKGSVEGFGYSDALESLDGHWSFDDLAAFLEKPKEYLKGTKMAFSGIKDAEDLAAIIAYLRTMADEPVPLPKD